jgi:hypothetical protein
MDMFVRYSTGERERKDKKGFSAAEMRKQYIPDSIWELLG